MITPLLLPLWKLMPIIRKSLAIIIICNELPLRFVESEGFKAYGKILEPRFTLPSQMIVARDYM